MSDSPASPAPLHAQIDWDDQGLPHSRHYDDIYFSREQGIAETHYVFLEQNRLPERFAALAPHECLVIGETGFGTGLNFYCAWQCFAEHAPAEARLHMISVEKFPLTGVDLERAARLWPSLAAFSEPLLAQYVAVHPGFQQFSFDEGRVTLTLLIGDVLEQLPTLDARIDAWFLDGFAPAKNPDMWTPALFEQMARLSVPGTTLGTFTTTGWVRRALMAAGFTLRKVPGLGKKWEIMGGTFTGASTDGVPTDPIAPWYRRPPAVPGPRQALVIGAGLAGSATARSLASRGWQVEVLERHTDVAQEASGNPQGVLYLKLSAHGTALSRLILAGFGYTRRWLTHLQRGHDWDACGVLQLAFDAAEAARQAKLADAFDPSLLATVSRAQAEAIAGVALSTGGLFYPEGGWVHPPALCQAQLAHPRIQVRAHRQVLRLARVDGLWQAWDGERLLASAPVVVLAGAADVRRFDGCADLPLKRIRGQITRLPATEGSQALRTVLCAHGYVAPPRAGEHTLGASFDFHNQDLTPTVQEHQGNLDLLHEISDDVHTRLLGDGASPDRLQGRAAFRCTSPDYLPIVGPLADRGLFDDRYGAVRKDARQVPDLPCPWLEGLYVNSGHGSRGLITAPLCGELVAAWVTAEPLPVPREVAQACHPNRFALRTLIRGERTAGHR